MLSRIRIAFVKCYHRREFIKTAALAGIGLGISGSLSSVNTKTSVAEGGRIGLIGLDTSHVIAFTNTINDMPASSDYEGFKVVGAWPAMWVKSVYLPYTISHASLPVPQEA